MLTGLRVLEISSFVAAPLGGMTLAQLGADVVRVDPIGGATDTTRWPVTADGASIYWTSLNKGKRSLMVDQRTPEGRDLVLRLAAQAGVVLANTPKPAYEELAKARPGLIHVLVQGYPDGRPAVDYTVNAETGFPLVTGLGDAPVNHVLPAWDVACGLYAAVAILAADHHRLRTGEGRSVKIALSDVALATAGNLGFLGEAELNGVDRPRIGNHLFGGFARDFAVRDGRFMVVTLSRRHLDDLAKATGTSEKVAELEKLVGADFSDDGDRYRHREGLAALLEPWFAARTAAEAAETLARTSVLWSQYGTFRDLMARDHALLAEIDQPGVGRLRAPRTPIRDGAPREPRPAPVLGADAESVLGTVGLTPGEVAELREKGVVG
ncbi:CoA transferase [Actinocorallia sp. A-T 12471]|uniref:CoA transferase n=1 Tax=Actinocorallia sp. A-T 12471 TaxID=3089813 RepID=UPI0029CC62AF|nr:CoA transferase [Actinocorallia sp. A-T 12471]MDX6739398.1 CoA transferase [Actinocorallia sp. A-T 12471]